MDLRGCSKLIEMFSPELKYIFHSALLTFLSPLSFSFSLQALQPRAFDVVNAAEDVGNVSPCEMESIINQLMNPNPEYQLHVSPTAQQQFIYTDATLLLSLSL